MASALTAAAILLRELCECCINDPSLAQRQQIDTGIVNILFAPEVESSHVLNALKEGDDVT